MSYISITIFIQLQIHIVDKNFSTFFQSFMLSNLISHYRLITNDNSTLLYILCSRFLRKNISTNLRALRGFPNRVCDEIATSDRTLFWTVLARRSPIACIYIDSKIYRIRLQTSEKIPKVQIVTRLL